ncbi:MAG: dUTP diphosphatase [Hyphomicrobiales bacterium]|nr:MAG: dUTP diphosphatase [Hyphomicrobiales bacterium]
MTDRLDIGLRWLEHGRGLAVPRQQTAGAAGVDLPAALGPDEVVTIAPGGTAMIPTGFAIALPEGFEAQIRPRSGLAARHAVTVLNSPGTVDADYRGEVKVMLINHGQAPFEVRRGDRIAQMVVAPVSAVSFSEQEVLDDTERGDKGHGSTGR